MMGLESVIGFPVKVFISEVNTRKAKDFVQEWHECSHAPFRPIKASILNYPPGSGLFGFPDYSISVGGA